MRRRHSHRPERGRRADRRGGHDRTFSESRERIATIAVTLRAFARASGAEVAMLLLDRGDGSDPFVVECPADGPVMLVEGEHGVELDPASFAADPLPLPAIPAPPRQPIDPDALRPALAASAAVIGPRPQPDPDASRDAAADPAAADPAASAPVDPAALATATALASAMRALIALFPGRSVLTATFPTADEAIPFHLAVRTGDPIVASLGGQQFELPLGWPA